MDGNISHIAVRNAVFSLVDKQIQKSRAWHECLYNITEENADPQLNITVKNKAK